MAQVCSARIFQGFHGHSCGKKGKVQVEGKWYCGTHDPIKKKAKMEARDAKWNAEWKADTEKRERIQKLLAACSDLTPEEVTEAVNAFKREKIELEQ